jgi:hypothetical protein
MPDRPGANLTPQQRARWNNVDFQSRESELSWGAGLVPPGLEDAPAARGGMYKGMAPPVDMTAESVRSAARARRGRS